MGPYTIKYKTRKWTLVALLYVLHMARINSQAVYVINNAKEDVGSSAFGRELMKTLVKPNMHTRSARRGLSKHLQNSITHMLGVEKDKVEQPPPNDDTRKSEHRKFDSNSVYCCSIFQPKYPIILQFYQSFINIYLFALKLVNKNEKNIKCMQK